MSNTDYPKMLYKGNKTNYEHQTALNEESEKELLDSGWAGFGELPEPKLESKLINDSGINKLQILEEENTILKEELVEALKDNQELRKQIRLKELEDKPADELKAILDGAEIKYKANAGKPELAQLVLDHESKDSKE
ncbi:hypothetical protein [Acinetobacter lwoffii]|uniref:hypothetical protein n=1 Tax=Acinetobacter lwoffii TaxID=28090 RepID=UPI002DB606CB|nr:hypothetical protein [Acinetobacter lwoffii]MEB6681029.1 hypothetical protein [Acinetobacter lwoffii]